MRAIYWIYQPMFVNAYYVWITVSLVIAYATGLRRMRALYSSHSAPRPADSRSDTAGAVSAEGRERGTTLRPRQLEHRERLLTPRQAVLLHEAAVSLAALRGLTRITGAAVALLTAFGALATLDRPFNHPTRTLTGGDLVVELAFGVLPHVVIGLAAVVLLCIAGTSLDYARHRRRLAWLRSV